MTNCYGYRIMITVTYTKKHTCEVDGNIAMNNARVDIGGQGDKVRYRVIKVKNRVRKPNSDCSSWIWSDVEHYECQKLEEHFFSKDLWKTMEFHDENTGENGVSEFDNIEEIRNWLVALDGDRIEEVKLYK